MVGSLIHGPLRSTQYICESYYITDPLIPYYIYQESVNKSLLYPTYNTPFPYTAPVIGRNYLNEYRE